MKISKIFSVFFLFSLFVIGVTPSVDPDMWWHLKTGQRILGKGIPSSDVFSFTVPGRAWTAHEWLSEVLMWLIFRSGGLTGVILWVSGMSLLTFGLLYKNCPAGKPYPAGLAVFLSAVTAGMIGWSAGPKLFTYFLAAVFIVILEKWRRGKQARFLWTLPLLSVLWVNLHGGYVLGLALIFIYVAGGIVAGDRSLRLKRLVKVWIVSLLATTLNPQGFHIWIYPFLQMTSPVQRDSILEWQSPNFHSPNTWPFVLMLGVCILGMLKNKKHLEPARLILFFGSALMAFMSIRHIPLFAVVNAPLLCDLVADIWKKLGGPDGDSGSDQPAAQRILNILILVAALASFSVYTVQKIKTNDKETAKLFPVAATNYLRDHGLDKKRGYNDYDFGGYLIWRDIPVFVDGRADMYGDAFLKKYFTALRLKDKWREVFDDYKIDYAILGKDRPLATLLAESPKWQEVYKDDTARIFARN